MKIFISAAETSSDTHGAQLLRAIREQLPADTAVEFYGIGGPKLQQAGLQAVVDARELLVMGFVEVLVRLPRILRAFTRIVDAVRARKPDIAIVIDYPDFHMRLAGKLKALGVPLVYYIPPKVWLWRKGRVNRIRALFNRVLCILPFEEEFYRRHDVSAKYVGNPLADELPLKTTRQEARAALGFLEGQRILLLMPGSRPSEMSAHLIPLLEAARHVAERFEGKLHVLIPVPETTDLDSVETRVRLWSEATLSERLELRVSQGDAPLCMLAADAALIKSGTSTLEAGLLGCPHTVVYRPSWSTEWIFKNVVRHRGPVGLVNLALGWKEGEPGLVREILCGDMTVEALTDEAYSLFTDEPKLQRMRESFRRLREGVIDLNGQSPSERAAQEVLAALKEARAVSAP
jgi:lipid-A-disaccharide synthase